MGNTQDAMEFYEKAINADSKYAAAYFNKGVLYDRLSSHEEAITCLDEAINLDPKKANALFYKGIVLGSFDIARLRNSND